MKKTVYVILAAALVLILSSLVIKSFSAEVDTFNNNQSINNQPAQPAPSVPPAAEINVASPLPGEAVASPLTITGQARGSWYFEASFPIVLLNADGQQIGQTVATAQADWMTENFVPFKAVLEFTVPATASGTLVLRNDNPSGLPANAKEIKIPVFFQELKKTEIKVFFSNNKLDPEMLDCSKVYPAIRYATATPAIARAAIEELLSGPSTAEKDQGFITSINPDVKIQSLIIDKGLAKIDFDKQLEKQVGGSCRVTAISAQIKETLKQFSSVQNVLISIDGRTEDILQP